MDHCHIPWWFFPIYWNWMEWTAHTWESPWFRKSVLSWRAFHAVTLRTILHPKIEVKDMVSICNWLGILEKVFCLGVSNTWDHDMCHGKVNASVSISFFFWFNISRCNVERVRFDIGKHVKNMFPIQLCRWLSVMCEQSWRVFHAVSWC